jgi:hypothetical protein
MTCEHNLVFIRVIAEDIRKKDGKNVFVFITKWVCQKCGKPEIKEYYE